MKWMFAILAVLMSPSLWAREGFIETRDGKVYTGQVLFHANNLLVANAVQDFSVSVPLTNLLAVRLIPEPRPSFAPAPPLKSEMTRWLNMDIGAVPLPGSATMNLGVFRVQNSGTNIAGANDSCQFVYKKVKGDSEIVTRVLQVRRMAPWAKAGLMMRESLQSDSPNIMLAVKASGGGLFQYRDQAGNPSVESPVREVFTPYWLKLKREGSSFTAYTSPSGRQWHFVQKIDLPMEQEIYVGLAVAGAQSWAYTGSSSSNSWVTARLMNEALFDNVHEGPCLPGWFVPRIAIQNGSTAVGRIAWADASEVHFEGGLLGPDPLPLSSVSCIFFQWLPSYCKRFIKAGRPGVILASGEFFEGDFKGMKGNRVQISSVLMGLRSFDVTHELWAVILRPPLSFTPAYEIQTEQGWTWYGDALQSDHGDLLVEQSLLGVRKVPSYEIRSIRLVGTPPEPLHYGNLKAVSPLLANLDLEVFP